MQLDWTQLPLSINHITYKAFCPFSSQHLSLTLQTRLAIGRCLRQLVGGIPRMDLARAIIFLLDAGGREWCGQTGWQHAGIPSWLRCRRREERVKNVRAPTAFGRLLSHKSEWMFRRKGVNALEWKLWYQLSRFEEKMK